MNSRKTSLKLKHKKIKVNYKEIEVDDYSAPIVVDGKVLELKAANSKFKLMIFKSLII
jgi:hypothetical protein